MRSDETANQPVVSFPSEIFILRPEAGSRPEAAAWLEHGKKGVRVICLALPGCFGNKSKDQQRLENLTAEQWHGMIESRELERYVWYPASRAYQAPTPAAS